MKNNLFLFIFLFAFLNHSFAQDDLYLKSKTIDHLFEKETQTRQSWKKRKKRLEEIEEKKREIIKKIREKDPNIYFARIDKQFKIRDKVFVVNKSSLFLQQIVLAKVNHEGFFEPIVNSIIQITPGQELEIASFSNNELEKLQSEIVAIKIKGTNKHKTPNSQEEEEREITTYKFEINLAENKHDLYISVFDSTIVEDDNRKSIMDF